MAQQQYRSVVYLSDTSGTGFWRRIQQINQLNCISQSTGVMPMYSQFPVLDAKYYQGVNSITVQRWISDQQRDLFCGFFKHVMDQQGGWLIYEIDDNMSDKAIPLYNRGRKAFEGEHIQNNIKQMLNAADFVTVTTDYLKKRYNEMYGIPLENILAVPNLISRFWFGDRYHPERKLDQFRKNKQKPRIGLVSSLSHFNVDNVRIDSNGLACRLVKDDKGERWENERNETVKFEDTEKITDDFDDIVDCVRSTVNDFQWVFFGYCPPQIKDLADAHKVEVHGGVPILSYASTFDNLNLQAVIAPIKKTDFNFSKSFIKTMECATLGVPLFATNCLPYNRMMKATQLFDTADELKEKLMKLKFCSAHIYQDMIEDQWKWFNTPRREGDFNIKNFWLEDNVGIFIDMFKLRQHSRMASMSYIKEQRIKAEEERRKSLLFEDKDSGVEIIR